MTVETYVYPLDADMMCIYIIFLYVMTHQCPT